MANDEKAKSPQDVRKLAGQDKQAPLPAMQAEMIAFMHQPVMEHRERRSAPAQGKKPSK